jgi:deazaflavin-dependent oxidoreductase (nitroreductase family)
MYALIGFLDPWIRPWWAAFGFRNVVDLRVVGRRTGAPRRVLLTLLRDGDQWFLGHPNGHVAWTRNLEAAGSADLVFRKGPAVTVTARRLDPDDADPAIVALRDRAIASFGQHPFPGNVIYRLARAHIRVVGVYFAIDRASVG